MITLRSALLLVGLSMFSGCATPKRDLNFERLEAQWKTRSVTGDREFVPPLAAEVDQLFARFALAKSNAERAQIAYLLERQIAIFETGVMLEKDSVALRELEQQNANIRIELAEIFANKAHLESERTRLQALADAEAADRRLQDQREEAETLVQQQTQAAELAQSEAQLAREMAEIQARDVELARREAELRGDQVSALERQIAGLKTSTSARGKSLILSDAFFASGQGELLPAAKKNLKPVLDFLRKYPALPVLIEGHTDGKGSASGNLKLSELRAQSVKASLIAQGADAARLSAQGFGETLPLSSNELESGRAKNRRVEIIIEGAK